MKANELKKNDRVWCWWGSRNLTYTGRIINRKPSAFENDTAKLKVFVFKDICGVEFWLNEEEVAKLQKR